MNNYLKFMMVVLTALCAVNTNAVNILISTPNTSLGLVADEGKELKLVYYGAKIGKNDLDAHVESGQFQYTPTTMLIISNIYRLQCTNSVL